MFDVHKDNRTESCEQVFSVSPLSFDPERCHVAVSFPREILFSLADHAGDLVDAIVSAVGGGGRARCVLSGGQREAKAAREEATRKFLTWGCELAREWEIRRDTGEPSKAIHADMAARHEVSRDIIKFAISRSRRRPASKVERAARSARDVRIIRMAMDGASNAEIGREVGLHPLSVSRLLGQYRRSARTASGERLASVLRGLDRQAAIQAARVPQ
jgi:hypothetical protein